MRDRLIELLSEEIKETKNLTHAVIRETTEIKRSVEVANRKADIAQESAVEARRKADAAWELVIIASDFIRSPKPPHYLHTIS